ncbi:hypothetical protein Ae168Ps1_5972 [Pseudonocardia sp. Ae168_Ps1]|nr:hypothetical protein Ae168Ps1_5972 [Pseudonocardia sp. Ae168_Ps1]OLL76983.1 hypothetical protein Ae150APs1_5361c [Pseudonocardia sp. Ae150A_Ps1]OLL88905.1 hypothetical protein Ae263Ps1_5960 [Pseudonocardia sp. Ae263_Ps1]OLL91070.1 hypothetical protein Ae356Ps1_0967c [Pseudonocardia sp. Ae356_Ps1]
MLDGSTRSDPKEVTTMHDTASVGDRIVVEAAVVDHGRRRGEVVEVLGGDDEQVRYRVRWSDGSESLYFPGADAHVEHA